LSAVGAPRDARIGYAQAMVRELQTRRSPVFIGLWLVAVLALLLAYPGAALAQEQRAWRTVIIPAPVQPTPAPLVGAWATTVTPPPGTRPPLTTASLQPAAPPAKPLVGIAHETVGIASYYWQDQMTASGERFDKRAMTAAHRTLPMGTRVKVTHTASGRSVVVRINDRGPFKPGRVIDLSEAAAEVLDMTRAGLAQVTLDVVR
jgi:hypothetical protein